MHIFNISKLDEVKSNIPIKGSLALRDLYLWPAWYKPTTSVLFSYQRSHQPRRVYNVPIEEGKVYSLGAIQELIRDHVNVVDQVANLYFNNGRITLNVQKDKSVHNLKLCKELADILKLPRLEKYEGLISGDEVDVNKIRLTFNSTDLLYFKCEELDESKVTTSNTNSDVMAIVPLQYSTHNSKLIQFKDTKPLYIPLTQRKTVYNLNFSIEDPHGNKLPFHKCIITVLNKDELL